jgi:tetratricopeptide (TPR) repeat protein
LNVIEKSAFYTCLLFGLAVSTIGCGGVRDLLQLPENGSKCRSVDPDVRITACTELIDSGLLNAENLSIVYNNRGTAYSSKGDHDRAIQDLNEAIRLSPNHAYMYRTRGIEYGDEGNYDQAIQDLNEAIHLNPKDPSVYVVRGDAYRGKNDYDRAIQDFNEAIRLKPNDGRAYYGRGTVYSIDGDYGRAIQNYDEAIRLNPNDIFAYRSRGNACYHKGDYARAIENYNEAIRRKPNFALAYEGRGIVYSAQSNQGAAIADLEHAISIAPSSSVAIFAALTLHVIMKRQGHDDRQQLAPVVTAADLSKWPGPLVKLDLGQMTVDEVMVAATGPGSNMQKLQVCEANYFTGEDALFHHQRPTAVARLEAARDSCPKSDTGYVAALAELKRLGVPTAKAK